jgi:antitoxin MazE
LSAADGGCIFVVDTSGGESVRAKIQKWGNSLALRVPKAVAELIGVSDGAEVELSVDQNRLVITPARRRRYTLQELVAGITEENRRDEIDTGPSVGNEAW